MNTGTDVDETPKHTVVVAPSFETGLGITPETAISAVPRPGLKPAASLPALAPKFTKPEEVAAAKATIEAIAKVVRDPQLVPTPKALKAPRGRKRQTLGRPAHPVPDIDKLTDDKLVGRAQLRAGESVRVGEISACRITAVVRGNIAPRDQWSRSP